MSIHKEIPHGYKIEWCPDNDFELLTFWQWCSRPKCNRQAVAVLRRTVHYPSGVGKRRQYCCPEHMYGREIRLGKVMIDCLVKEEGSNG